MLPHSDAVSMETRSSHVFRQVAALCSKMWQLNEGAVIKLILKPEVITAVPLSRFGLFK